MLFIILLFTFYLRHIYYIKFNIILYFYFFYNFQILKIKIIIIKKLLYFDREKSASETPQCTVCEHHPTLSVCCCQLHIFWMQRWNLYHHFTYPFSLSCVLCVLISLHFLHLGEREREREILSSHCKNNLRWRKLLLK